MLRKKRRDDYKEILGGSTWVHSFGLPCPSAIPPFLQLQKYTRLPWEPLLRRVSAWERPRLLRLPPRLRPRAGSASAKPPRKGAWPFLKNPFLSVGKMDCGSSPPSPPLPGQHSTSGAAGRARPALVSVRWQLVGGRREGVGMGTRGKRDRDGRDP